jgi:hypothetical protein
LFSGKNYFKKSVRILLTVAKSFFWRLVMDNAVLQSIIGTDKRNPYLQVCMRSGNGQLEIYYGAQLLETVVDDKEHIAFHAAAGRLYNAGLNRAQLQEVFNVDRKTMQRWGAALLAPDAESSIRGLRSRRDPRKLTVEVRKFAEVRFEQIYKYNRSSYIYSLQIKMSWQQGERRRFWECFW